MEKKNRVCVCVFFTALPCRLISLYPHLLLILFQLDQYTQLIAQTLRGTDCHEHVYGAQKLLERLRLELKEAQALFTALWTRISVLDEVWYSILLLKQKNANSYACSEVAKKERKRERNGKRGDAVYYFWIRVY